MSKQNYRTYFTSFCLLICASILIAQENSSPFLFGDPLPDAPELAKRGDYSVGVRTLDLVNKNQVDILNFQAGQDIRYDRPLKVEVWYPAKLKKSEKELVTYDEVLGMSNDPKRPLVPFTFQGRASRDATPVAGEEAFPLIIVSHGYVGSRYIMTYLTENLASKGYIVVAIDHTESTFRDAGAFQSTLLNRSKDILFVLNEMAKIGAYQIPKDFLSGIIDANNTAIIGYSMGGYGALNVAGAGYSDAAGQFFTGMSGGSIALATRSHSNPEYRATVDPRIKAVVAFAPWGMMQKVWDAEGLKGLSVPTFFIAGDQDDISGYENGIKAIFSGATQTNRYLLTYANARHNVAPNPPPAVALTPGLHFDEYYRYAEPAWDQRRMNNINQHFITAFLGTHLKKKDFTKLLELPPNSNEKTWPGFLPRTSTGLELLFKEGVK